MNKTTKKKVVIIGAGAAGLTSAYELSKNGVDSLVLEKDQVIGGISRTVNYKNYYFDIGGHRFFSKIDEVNKIWHEILCDSFLKCKRLSRIYYNKKFFNYPLRPVNALKGLGLWNSFMILSSYFNAKIFPSKEEDNFEQWVSNRFGKRLYRTFFKTYTEKVWGIPCTEIRAEWAAQRIKGLSLIKAIREALIKSNNTSKKNVIKTLIDSFEYPCFGPGMMWDEMKKRNQRNGSEIIIGAEVCGILWEKDRIVSLEVVQDGEKHLISGTHFISSMPIRELIKIFKPGVPENILNAANSLNYRDFITVALIINKKNIFPDNWIYIHEPTVRLGRIQNYKNWSSYMVPDQNKTCLGLEYFCFEGDEFWSLPDEELIKLGTKEIEILGFIHADDVEDGTVVRMPKAYPVYDAKYRDYLNIIIGFLRNFNNIQLVGRNGMHRYNNMDHSMLTSIYAAENINGARHDLWAINEEQEYNEEKIEELHEKIIPNEMIVKAFKKVDKLGFGTAIGSVSGLSIFFATIFLILKGGEVIGPNLTLLGQYFVGYTVTFKGAFIGMAYCFFSGFLLGWFFAYVRNFFKAFFIYRVKRKKEMISFMDFINNF